MKKLLIAVPLVAGVGAAAFAGTSQYAGTQTQNEYQQLLTQMNGALPFNFVNEKYDSGLGKSSAITKVMTSQAADAEVLFRLYHDIQHAAVRMDGGGVKIGQVSISTTLHGKDTLPPELLDVMTDAEPFALRTDISFSGDTQHQLNVSGIEMNEGGAEFSWSGISFDGATSKGATVGSGSMGAITVNDVASGGMLSVGSSPFTVDMQDAGDMLYTGKAGVAFNDVKVLSPELPIPVSFSSIGVDTDTNIKSDKLSTSTRILLAGIESPLPLNEASLDIVLDGLGVEGIREYQQLVNTLSADLEDAMADPAFLPKITSAFQSIVQPGSAMKYAVNLANDEGDAKADFRVGLKAESEEGMSSDALSKVVTGRDLLNILSVTGALDADTQALAQTPVMMMLGGIGDFVTVTDESITSEISLNGTTLVINGMELPLDVMSGGMLDIPLSDLTQL